MYVLILPNIHLSINRQLINQFLQDARCISTLKFLAEDNISLGEVHPVWVSTENSVTGVWKAIVKARILTGTCLLQTNIHGFSQYREDPTCKFCKQQEEDKLHMLMHRPLLTDTRLNSFKIIRDFVKYHIGNETWKNSFSSKEDLVQLIIDSRKFSHLFGSSDIILEIEKHSRNLCYKLYNERLSLLRNLEDGFP